MPDMIQSPDNVMVELPRSVLADIVRMSGDLTDRMHFLLERNTDGMLVEAERAELESLVRVAQLSQIVAVALGRSAS